MSLFGVQIGKGDKVHKNEVGCIKNDRASSRIDWELGDHGDSSDSSRVMSVINIFESPKAIVISSDETEENFGVLDLKLVTVVTQTISQKDGIRR